jgi:2-methylcitrate dehydratase PrpD
VRHVDVRVATSEAKTVNDREMPDISLQHMVAVMLLDQTVTFQAAHDTARMKDAALLREKAKVQLIPDEDLERLYPRRVTVVEVTLADGEKLTERVEAVRGTAENPMTRQDVVAKCRDLMNPVLGTTSTNQLIAKVMDLEKSKDIRELRPLLQA